MQPIKGLKDDTLYKNLLPRTLSFADVLQSKPVEEQFTISDMQVDDFYMFRYELHSMLNKHMYQDEEKSEYFLLGRKPLSKVQGQPVKDFIKNLS